MSSGVPVSPEDRPYLAQVEEFFISTIRKGLMLRSSDIDTIRDWESRNIPVNIVCKGISTGVRRFLEGADPGQPLPSVLKYYRTFVEAEYESHTRAMARGISFDRNTGSDAAGGTVQRGIDILERLAADAGTDTSRVVFLAAVERLKTSEIEDNVEVLESVDSFVTEALIETAPRKTASLIMKRVDSRIDDAVEKGLGRMALEDVRQSALREAAAKEFGYPGLVTMILGTNSTME